MFLTWSQLAPSNLHFIKSNVACAPFKILLLLQKKLLWLFSDKVMKIKKQQKHVHTLGSLKSHRAGNDGNRLLRGTADAVPSKNSSSAKQIPSYLEREDLKYSIWLIKTKTKSIVWLRGPDENPKRKWNKYKIEGGK